MERRDRMRRRMLQEVLDKLTYQELLTLNRYVPSGDALMSGVFGGMFVARLRAARDELTIEQQVAVSKAVGWGGDSIITRGDINEYKKTKAV